MKLSNLTFLKLGGSLITDKAKPQTPLPHVIHRIADEIAQAVYENPDRQWVIGHGSGSFGHAVANQYQTHMGGDGEKYWRGFAQVWAAARQLNQIVIQQLSAANLPVIAFPPSAGVIADNKSINRWDLRPMQRALEQHLIPVVQGDVVFDNRLGGTILSTEEIFLYLAKSLEPGRILLAGSDPGVLHTPDQPVEVIPHITPANIKIIFPLLSGAKTADVTGGMLAKVQSMLSLVNAQPAIEVRIFSGAQAGNIYKALTGTELGTLITV